MFVKNLALTTKQITMNAKEFKEKYKEELKKVPIDLDNPKHGWAGWWLEEQVEYLMESYAKQYHASQQMPSEEEITKEAVRINDGNLDRYKKGMHYNSDWKAGAMWLKSLQQENQTED